MQTTRIDTHDVAERLVAARPVLDAAQQRIALALYRLLAEGRPVARDELAERARVPPADAERFLGEHPGVLCDDRSRVVGFWGLALDGMAHRMTVGGRELRAWCAWDTLFLPELLGQTATVASTCPTTGEPVELLVTPDGVADVSPAGAVLSFVRREQPFDADIVTTFCHLVHFFASRDAGAAWTAQHPGTFVLSIEEGAQIARLVNAACFVPR